MMGNARAGAMGSAIVGILGLLAARSMAYDAAPVVNGGTVTGTLHYAGSRAVSRRARGHQG